MILSRVLEVVSMEDATKDSTLGPKEDVPMVEEDVQFITEAEPLAWRPPADQVQHPMLMPSYVNGQTFGLPEGWLVQRRPRTSLKYIGKVDKFYYEPGTKRLFRSLKAALKHVQEMIEKQNDQQPLQPRPKKDHEQDRELPRPQSESDHNQALGEKHERKPVTLELGDEFEPGERSQFRRMKDVHRYLRARGGQLNNQQPPQSQPQNNHQ